MVKNFNNQKQTWGNIIKKKIKVEKPTEEQGSWSEDELTRSLTHKICKIIHLIYDFDLNIKLPAIYEIYTCNLLVAK